MKLLIIFVLVLAITVPTIHGQRRILNGQNATLGQFRYQARIDLKREKPRKILSCGGSLISRNYILTAANCLKYTVNATVYLGAIKRFEAEAYRYVSRPDFIVHDRYNDVTKENDIGLIKIPTVEFTDNIQPVKLPKLTEKRKFRNKNVIVTGWERIWKKKPTLKEKELLLWTRWKVLSNEDCLRQTPFSSFIKESSLCANPKSHKCLIESGSPVVLENTEKQVAFVSWRPGGFCAARIPSVFVRITDFLQWIKDNSDVSF